MTDCIHAAGVTWDANKCVWCEIARLKAELAEAQSRNRGHVAVEKGMLRRRKELQKELAEARAESRRAGESAYHAGFKDGRREAMEEAAKVCDRSEAEHAKLTLGKREAVDELWACQQEAGALAGQIRRLAQPLDNTPPA